MTTYLLDCETTDRKPPLEVIEVAWLKFPNDIDMIQQSATEALLRTSDHIPKDPWLFDDTYKQRFKPSIPITYGAMATHHILPHELENKAPSSAFRLPADCTYLVGHSIDFDWEAIGCPPVKRICTDAMARHVWPDATGYSQGAISYMLCGGNPAFLERTRDILRHAHSAMTDVSINAHILRAIIDQAKVKCETWAQLWEFSELCRVPLTCPLKRWEGIKLEHMEQGAIDWLLNQHWLDKYLRIGLERVCRQRYGEQ